MFRHISLLSIVSGLLIICTVGVSADLVSPQAKSNAQPPGFIDRLAKIVPAWTQPHRIVLYVDRVFDPRQQLPVSSDGTAPDLGTPEGLAGAYNLAPQWFGRVLAIVPATSTALNTDDSLAEMPLEQLEKLHPIPALLGSLTSDQLNLLATTGLGESDLTPDQQTLFQDLIPSPFKVVSSDTVEPEHTLSDMSGPSFAQVESEIDAFSKEVITVPQDYVLGHVKLHAFLDEQYIVNSDRGSWSFNTHGLQNYSSGDKKLTIASTMPSEGADTPEGDLQSLMMLQIPNVPKSGNLSWRLKALTSTVSLNGLKTVDDLVLAIAKATHLELYADVSYEHCDLYVGGDIKDGASAVDLLQALALCVCGTWRQVGPAYILTDDVAGLAARQQRLADVTSTWSNRIQYADSGVADRLKSLNWQSNLYLFPGDSRDVPKDQLLAATDNGSKDQGEVKWSALPPAAQMALTKQMTEQSDAVGAGDGSAISNEMDDNAASIAAILKSITPSTTVDVKPQMEIALELPDSGIMSFQSYNMNSANYKGFKYPTSADKIALTEPLRGVLCAPKTINEAKSVVDMLTPLGLNTVLLDVFNNGRTYFNSASIQPENDDAKGMLGAALEEARLKHVNVYAVVDTLCWRKDGMSPRPAIWPSQFEEDVNVFGESSEKGVQRRLSENAINLHNGADIADIQGNQASCGWVSPVDSTVRSAVAGMIKELASVSGLSGIILQDTAPPGYDGVNDGQGVTLKLGYTEENRLAFLRSSHIDPIDEGGPQSASMWLPFEGSQGPSLNFNLPGFENIFFSNGEDPWAKFIADADLSLLRECYLSVKSVRPNMPLYMRERQLGLTIDPWTSPVLVDQIPSLNVTAQPFSYIGRQTMVVIPTVVRLKSEPDSMSFMTNLYRSQFAKGKEGGLIFDLEAGGITDSAPKLLSKLAPYLASPNLSATP